jgi:asparagine synthase (glutamine-hydrolysing)
VADADNMLKVLEGAVKEECDEAEAGVLFSGGLDSTVLAKLASTWCQVRLYTIGMPESHDLKVAEETASDLDMRWEGILLDRRDILRALPRISEIIGTDNPLVLSFEMPLYIVSAMAKERLLISGQGADELFGGYARYARMSEAELSLNLDQDLKSLLTVGMERERKIADAFGKDIRHPYLHRAVVEMAQHLPMSELIRDGERKKVLRDVATLLHLGPVAARPKKAAQYGSGVMRQMRSEAKERGIPISDLASSLRREETL